MKSVYKLVEMIEVQDVQDDYIRSAHSDRLSLPPCLINVDMALSR